MNEPYIAHVSEDKERVHTLEEHLIGVSRFAEEFASGFGSGDWARLAGLWHDLGKYSSEFQRKIRSETGLDPEAHIETRSGCVDHSTIGAVRAIEAMDHAGRILAYVVAGHHSGLTDWSSVDIGKKALAERINGKDRLPKLPVTEIPSVIGSPVFPISKPPQGGDPALWIRMLFSCIVDADFLDTECFMKPEKFDARGNFPDLRTLVTRLNDFMLRKQAEVPGSPVNVKRSEVFARCVEFSTRPRGVFSLTVPTGGGKTLSSLAFAMNHSLHHTMSRIIYVIPYTSIIEQTAAVFRDALGGEAVLEHHCNFDGDNEVHETSRSRLASENWDAPVIVTTSVQFFESLFASRTSRCRKLHNIVNSVVVLDEAQLLPPEFLNPILRVIDELREHYGVSFVLCTATQPAFSPISTPSFSFKGLEGITEIIKDPTILHNALRRVKVDVPEDLNKPIAWADLAEEISRHETVLCIVNKRDDARRLFEAMPEGTFHLSGLMCGAHRSETIKTIKDRLKNGEPTRLVSTQLVEAGVDIDFPVVYRALAGLDSIAQAAGRCNREGRMRCPGRVVIFVPPSKAPPGHLRQGADGGRQLLSERVSDPLSPGRFERYFRELFWKRGDGLDKRGILEDLDACRGKGCEIAFRTAASKFRIIDESAQKPVLVRYGEEGDSLIRLLGKIGPERRLLRKLQRYVVNIPRNAHEKLLREGGLIEVAPGMFAQVHSGQYDSLLGFLVDRSCDIPLDDLLV